MNVNWEEFNLSSSMSPEVNKNKIKKTSSKKISKLALKKALRRSSVYDKLPCLAQNDFTISDTTESTSVDSAKISRCTDTPMHSKNGFAVAQAELKSGTPTKSSKSNEIMKWVTEVNANKNDLYDCNMDIESCNVSVFNDISAICINEDKAKPNICPTNTYLLANSTFLDDKNGFRFNDMLCTRTRTFKHLNDTNKNNEVQNLKRYGTQTAITSNKTSGSVSISDESINEDICLETPPKTVTQIEEHEKILDELYGHSWRSNKEKVLTPLAPNNLKKVDNKNKIYSKSEIKAKTSITHKNPYLFNEISKSNNLLCSLQTKRIQQTAFSLMNKFRNLCDSESSIESLNSKPPMKCKVKLNFDVSCSDDENCDFDKNLIKDITKVDGKENFCVNGNNIGRFEKNINKASSNCPTKKNLLKNVFNLNKEDEENLYKNETDSEEEIITNKKIVILDNRVKNKNNENKKSSSKKEKPLKQLKNVCNGTLDLLEQKESISIDKIGKEILQSNIKTDLNCVLLKDYFKNLPKTTKKGVNHNNDKRDGTESFLMSLSDRIPPDRCDPSARIYRSTYKTSKTELAKKLFDLYNEKIFDNSIPSDTPIEWNDRMRGTAGFCYCKKITRSTGAVERSVRIALATKILDSADRLRDTLVHEMCHAATWIVNEVADGHGPFWKSWAAKATRTFPELPGIQRCHDYQINTKYTYKCSDCGYSIHRHSKSLDIERKRCGYCYGKFEIFINKITKGGVQSLTPVTHKKNVTGFALYVKENYGSARKANMKHADVMKSLSKQFKELKTK